MAQSQTLFPKGNRVEIRRPSLSLSKHGIGPQGGAFYPATVIRCPTRSGNEILVEYHTLVSPSAKPRKRPREYVDRGLVRPSPPGEFGRTFKVGDAVDAYYDNIWQQGIVVEACGVLRYVVFLEEKREEVELAQFNLRLRREWIDGRWVPPLSCLELTQDKLSDVGPRNKKLKLKITFGKNFASSIFKHGQTVEVTSNQVGFEGSWYTAVIVDSIGNDKYLVEYRTLLKDDETGPLREETSLSCIRPYPPQIQEGHFKRLDKVDAWYNDGWWEGIVSKALTDQNYVVYFSTNREELVFTKSSLRLHQEWVEGKWIIASKDASNALGLDAGNVENNMDFCERNSKVKFYEGMKVEVENDEDGYQDSWFVATVVDAIGDNKYLVEYQTLGTNDETEFLREEVAMRQLRPCPPDIQRIHPFPRLHIVDAWYNDGWWMGYISKILDDWNYQVYFKSTNEEMVFNHRDLRSHQDWIHGQWVPASKDKITM